MEKVGVPWSDVGRESLICLKYCEGILQISQTNRVRTGPAVAAVLKPISSMRQVPRINVISGLFGAVLRRGRPSFAISHDGVPENCSPQKLVG